MSDRPEPPAVEARLNEIEQRHYSWQADESGGLDDELLLLTEDIPWLLPLARRAVALERVAEIAATHKQGVCVCLYEEKWVDDPKDEIAGGYSVRGERQIECSYCQFTRELDAALAAVPPAAPDEGREFREAAARQAGERWQREDENDEA